MALDNVVERLQSPKRSVWQAAIDELGWWDPHNVEPLLPLLLHEHRGVREGVAHALGELRPGDDASIEALWKAMEDDDDYVRWKAIRALGRIGPAAVRALPAIRAAAEADDEVEVVQAAAKRSVREITKGT